MRTAPAFGHAPRRSGRELGVAGRRLRHAAAALLSVAIAATSPIADAAPVGKAHRATVSLATGAAADPQGKDLDRGARRDRQALPAAHRRRRRDWRAAHCPDIGGDTVAVSGDSRPKIAFAPDGRDAAIAWTRPLARPYTGAVRMLRSRDGGRSWSQPFTVHADRQITAHRFEAIAFDAAGNLHAWWVDKRDVEGTREPGASVFRSVAVAGAPAFGPDTRVARRSCECCRIALVPDTGDDGRPGVAALWRHVFEGSERDHAFAGAGIELGQPVQVVRATIDRWRIEACPHHGPGLARAAGVGYHAVWFTVRDGESVVRYGRLDPQGRPSSEPRTLPDPQAEHADIAAVGPRVVIAWRSFDGQRTRLRAWVSIDDGATFTQRELAATTGAGDQPKVLAAGGQLMVVWRTEQEIRIERIVD